MSQQQTNKSQEESKVSVPISVTSPLFCDDAADITFKSSDDVLFKIYQVHLRTSSAGFSIPDLTVVDDTPIRLVESADVLEILFQFIHPPSESIHFRQPSVRKLQPQLFFAVAEAAEKYIVYGAMNVFLTRMESELVDSQPIEVLNHAYRHGYPDLVDRAAYSTLVYSLQDINKGLTHPGLIQKWLAYYNRWRDVVLCVDDILLPALSGQCPTTMPIYIKYTLAVNRDIRRAGSITKGGTNCGKSGCPCEPRRWGELSCIDKAIKETRDRIANIPKFSTITS